MQFWQQIKKPLGTVLIPLLYFYNLAAIYFFPRSIVLPLPLVLLGLLMALCGVMLWFVSYINLGSSFGVLPQKQAKVRRGLYSITKHPMYMGIWLTFWGLSLSYRSLLGILFTLLIMTPLLIVRAKLEERKLQD